MADFILTTCCRLL